MGFVDGCYLQLILLAIFKQRAHSCKKGLALIYLGDNCLIWYKNSSNVKFYTRNIRGELMLLTDFMNENFLNLELRPPLFYSWDIGIRFELGIDWKREYDYPNNPYLLGCYNRAITLFDFVHSPADDIFVVIDVNDFNNGKNIKRHLKNFSPYVEKPLLYRLNHQIKPYIFPEDDEKGLYKTHRFTLKCKTSDFKYIPLLKAICNQDLGIRPNIFHRVYFINISTFAPKKM